MVTLPAEHRKAVEAPVGMKVGDLAMGSVVQQTGQTLKDHGFHCGEDWGPSSTDLGFTSAARTVARKKLWAW